MSMPEDVSQLNTGRRWLPSYRFGIGAGAVDMDGSCWHAVDLRGHGRQLAAAAAQGRPQPEVFSVCGARSQFMRRLGRFSVDSPFLGQQRCVRCGWVVALDQGTVEQEIDVFAAAAGHLGDGLLRRVFTSILADLPPGDEAQPGHRSDLLAHAARHAPTLAVCRGCVAGHRAEQVHGRRATVCPEAVLVCRSCTFTAGPWAGPREAVSTAECVVAAPCSVLVTLARYYELGTTGPRRSRR